MQGVTACNESVAVVVYAKVFECQLYSYSRWFEEHDLEVVSTSLHWPMYDAHGHFSHFAVGEGDSPYVTTVQFVNCSVGEVVVEW